LQEDTDLVIIATPNQWHEPYAIISMKSGKHVMCEKPATMSVAELDNIIACSKKTGKFFTVHQQRRFDPDYRAVCDVVKSGEIGNVTTIESRVFGERGVCFGWRADPESVEVCFMIGEYI
jgi:predicted dehydrogenase